MSRSAATIMARRGRVLDVMKVVGVVVLAVGALDAMLYAVRVGADWAMTSVHVSVVRLAADRVVTR